MIVVEDMATFAEAIRRHGPLLAVGMAAQLTGRSRQRLYLLVDSGRFTKLSLFGQVHIPIAELQAWQEGVDNLSTAQVATNGRQ